jgi:hypothetical protein
MIFVGVVVIAAGMLICVVKKRINVKLSEKVKESGLATQI